MNILPIAALALITVGPLVWLWCFERAPLDDSPVEQAAAAVLEGGL